MKTAQEIANILLHRRNNMNPVVMQGEMIATLESEGLQEALQRRWLVPQTETGYLMVSQDMSKVQEMREIAANIKEAPKLTEGKAWTRPWQGPNASHDCVLQHAHRNIDELLAPATGHDSGAFKPATAASPTTAPQAPAAPATSPTSSAPDNQPPAIGDEVTVVSGGSSSTSEAQTYTGKVSATSDGKIRIRFGDNKEQEYPANEVKVVKRA